ncbi:MAG: 5'/3'-nucleotidase SurE [Bacteriovoracaceae bacterium]
MKILTSNDDGVRADGNIFLREELAKNHEVITIAPNQERSSCGHGITLGEPIRLNQIQENVYSCSGFPADCVLVGLGHLLKNNRPDLVVSGINIGANLGQDRFYSGTVAAAREAAFRGVPAIAASLVIKRIKDAQHFDVAAKFISKIVSKDVHKIIPSMSLLNINVPNLPQNQIKGVRIAATGYQIYSEEVVERQDIRGKSYYWVGGIYKGHQDVSGSDCNAVDEGFISVNLQNLWGKDFEDEQTIQSLKACLD